MYPWSVVWIALLQFLLFSLPISFLVWHLYQLYQSSHLHCILQKQCLSLTVIVRSIRKVRWDLYLTCHCTQRMEISLLQLFPFQILQLVDQVLLEQVYICSLMNHHNHQFSCLHCFSRISQLGTREHNGVRFHQSQLSWHSQLQVWRLKWLTWYHL